MSITLPSSISSSDARARLICALVALIGVVGVGLGGYVLLPLSDLSSNRYLAAAFDKRDDLIDRDTDGAVLVFGGSTVAFSIATAEIEEGLGRPVRNLGLQASLGLAPLELYAPFFQPESDVLVIVADHATIRGAASLSSSQCDLVFLQKSMAAVLREPNCLPVVLWRQLQDLRYHLRAPSVGGSVYQRRYFNAHGDMIGHLGRASAILNPVHGSVDVADDRIDAFIQRIEALTPNIRRIVLPPPAAAGFCAAQGDALQRVVARVHAALDTSGLPLARQYCAADDLFYDGWWHLGESGRAQYSAFIEQALRERL